MKKNSQKKLISSAIRLMSICSALVFALSLITVDALAFEKTFTNKVRDGKRLVEEERTLTDLTSEVEFTGKYFKLVKGSTSQAVRFDEEDSLMVMRAATVYFHMSATRDYFDGTGLSDKSGLRKQMVIRIDEEDDLSTVFHFDQRPEKKTYNGSRIVPPSDPFMLSDLKDSSGNFVLNPDGSHIPTLPWENEIWFRKAKKVKRKSPLTYLSQSINTRDFKNMMMGNLLYSDMVTMTQSAVTGYFNPMDHLISMAFSIGISELIPQALGLVGKLVKQRYYLDSAMIPEIAIHEFSHIALSPVFGLKQSTALNEGFANYFAYKICGLKKLGARAGKYNLSDAPKSALNNAKYSFDQEMLKQAAYGSFTFSLLYDLDQALGEQGENILIQALNQHLKPDSTLRSLSTAIKNAINDLSKNDQTLDAEGLYATAIGVLLKRGL